VFDEVLTMNKVQVNGVYNSHWYTYLFEFIFMRVLFLYLSDRHYYVLKDPIIITKDLTIYTSVVTMVLAKEAHDYSKIQYTNTLSPIAESSAKAFWTNKDVTGVCISECNGQSGDLVLVKLGIQERFTVEEMASALSTVFHELVHSVSNQVVRFETDLRSVNLSVIIRQLMKGYVYWLMRQALSMWEGVEIPAQIEPETQAT
jgi:hypothetical protein